LLTGYPAISELWEGFAPRYRGVNPLLHRGTTVVTSGPGGPRPTSSILERLLREEGVAALIFGHANKTRLQIQTFQIADGFHISRDAHGGMAHELRREVARGLA
jgi:hypothetical protein